jgi:hypothetical protein
MSQGMEQKLSLRQRLALRLHILMCAGCRNTLRHFHFLREAIRKHPWKL